MRCVDSSRMFKVSCVALVLMSPYGKIFAEPFGSTPGYFPSRPGLLVEDKDVPQDLVIMDRFDALPSEIVNEKISGPNSGIIATDILLSAGRPELFSAQNAHLQLGSSMDEVLLAEVEAVPAPESSTLFLLGLGLVGLAQVPLRKLARKSPDKKQTEDGRADFLISETPIATAQKARATHEPHLNI